MQEDKEDKSIVGWALTMLVIVVVVLTGIAVWKSVKTDGPKVDKQQEQREIHSNDKKEQGITK